MFWDRFSELCTNKGIKPNPCAAAIGVSSATVTKWKNGTIPNGETLLKLSEYLNCSVDYLLGRTEIPQIEKAAPIRLDGSDNNIMVLAGRDGSQIRVLLSDEQYQMVYRMFCSFPDADDPEL